MRGNADAARGGLHQKRYVWGSDQPTPKEPRANLASTGTVAVASFTPNDYGLADIAGNVAEWCADYYQPDYYQHGARLNPKGPVEPKPTRVIRGSLRAI